MGRLPDGTRGKRLSRARISGKKSYSLTKRNTQEGTSLLAIGHCYVRMRQLELEQPCCNYEGTHLGTKPIHEEGQNERTWGLDDIGQLLNSLTCNCPTTSFFHLFQVIIEMMNSLIV